MSTFNVTGPVRLDVRVPHADVDVTTGAAGTATVALTLGGREADADQATVTCERRGDADVLTIKSDQRGIFRHRLPAPSTDAPPCETPAERAVPLRGRIPAAAIPAKPWHRYLAC